MSTESLEAAIKRAGNPVDFLRNLPYPAFDFPVAAEFSNWRSEQLAWRETVLLMDLSHHMSNLFIRGKDAVRFLSEFGVNTFKTFRPGMAKQYVATNSDGHFIGDGILFYLDNEYLVLVANVSLVNWMQYQSVIGRYDMSMERDDNSNQRKGPPRMYRYQLQGPNALAMVEKLIGGKVPEVKFFHMLDLTIGGKRVRALRHGMAGQSGFEMFGPWEDCEHILDTILKVGVDFGLKRGGARSYSTAGLESGWIPRPMTAIFGPKEKAFREWLPSSRIGSLGGSMYSKEITDYYHTPFDLGYGRLIHFDHDFLGKEACERNSKAPSRVKVTLEWNVDDVAAIYRSQMEPGLPAKYIEMPKARYAFFQVDSVLRNGKPAGMSTDVGYIVNDRAFISLASMDRAHAEIGTDVTVLWGEEPNSRKPAVEPHKQREVRATVAPWPYSKATRDSYRKS